MMFLSALAVVLIVIAALGGTLIGTAEIIDRIRDRRDVEGDTE